jgi:uncharacterized Zn finger protein (UPF0148 family)
MTGEHHFKGPLFVQPGEVACATCRDWIREGEPVFLVEMTDPEEPDAYVHLECVREYLGLEDL